MLILVTGGSGSGKSAFAEKKILELADGRPLYYIATMKVYGEEGLKKVERHRRLRQGKGFETLEQTRDAGKGMDLEINSAALLESMSNLVANEMFDEEGALPADQVTSKICADLEELGSRLGLLVIVTDNVFEDSADYDATTEEYIEALGRVNQFLAGRAAEVWEVVCGIPVKVK